jgi:hypothetical protein
MQFSPFSSFFGPNILLSTLFSNTLSLCSSLRVRDQVTHPYKIKGKINKERKKNKRKGEAEDSKKERKLYINKAPAPVYRKNPSKSEVLLSSS